MKKNDTSATEFNKLNDLTKCAYMETLEPKKTVATKLAKTERKNGFRD